MRIRLLSELSNLREVALKSLLLAILLYVLAPGFINQALQGKFDVDLLAKELDRRVALIRRLFSQDDLGFEAALDFTLKWEGGLSNHPNDIGGKTNRGITQADYDWYRTKQNLPHRDVELLTPEELQDYYQGIWQAAQCDRYPAPLSLVCFDTAVNFTVESWDSLFAKGVLPFDPKAAAKEVLQRRIDYRHHRVKESPDQAVFLQGWLNRDYDLLNLIETYL